MGRTFRHARGVTFHSGPGQEYPHAAVNVKLHGVDFELDPLTWAQTDGGGVPVDPPELGVSFARWYTNETDDDEREEYAQDAIAAGWDQLTEAARQAFGYYSPDRERLTVHAEGRSGGWAVVCYGERGYLGPADFIPEADADADQVAECAANVARWGEFEDAAKAILHALPSEAMYRAFVQFKCERDRAAEIEAARVARLEAVRLATFYYDVPPSFA